MSKAELRSCQELKASVLMVSRYFDPSFVGANRSIHLEKFLSSKGVPVRKLQGLPKETLFGFSLRVFRSVLTAKEPILYVSCGPFQYLPLAIAAAVLSWKRIVIDFRDPWSLNIEKKVIRFIARVFERISYFYCEHFIVCTPGMLERYENIFRDRGKLKLIMNGFDFSPGKYLRSRKKATSCTERFICLGKFFEYSEDKALKVISLLEKRGRTNGNKSELILVGDNVRNMRNIMLQMRPLEHLVVHSVPRVEYHEALSLAAEATAAVIVIRNEDYDFGTKVFDYIGLGLPILDSFDHNKHFFQTFKEFCIPYDGSFVRREPDLRFHRDNMWGSCIDIFL